MPKKEIYDKNPEKYRRKSRDYSGSHRREINERAQLKCKVIREEIITLLGGKCIICGYSGIAIQIDHVNNDGYLERGKGKCSLQYYIDILREIKAGSKDYQLLCANHNMEKELRRREKV